MSSDDRRQLHRQHQPRTLLREPRISRADEQALTDRARRTNADTLRHELADTLTTWHRDFERIRAIVAQIAPGNHRRHLREIEHALKALGQTANTR